MTTEDVRQIIVILKSIAEVLTIIAVILSMVGGILFAGVIRGGLK